MKIITNKKGNSLKEFPLYLRGDPFGARTQDPNIKSVWVENLYLYIYQLLTQFVKV